MRLLLRLNLIIFLLLSATIVYAHTPLDTGGENNSPETALTIDDPTKSWTLYEELEEVNYYRVHLHEGEELRVSLYVSIWGDEHFTPSLVIMGPDIADIDEPPFEHPEDLGRVIIHGERPEKPDYEPFTPASYYYVAAYSHTATIEGDYYIAVFSEEHGGRYGMALGYRETFTLFEWLKIPIDLVGIHLWEEQPLAYLFGPPFAVLIAGIYYGFIKGSLENTIQIIGRLASILFISSGAMTLAQMLIYLVAAGFTGSALLTLFFVAAQMGLGIVGVRDRGMNWLMWVGLGVGGLFLWAGWIIGPILAIATGLSKMLNAQSS